MFGVSVMDRQIEGYLVGMSKLDMRSDEYRRHVLRIHRMDFRARADMVKKHIGKESVDALFNEIKGIRAVRNAIAHSTADVNAEGTVIISVEKIDEVVGRGTVYAVDTLAEVLKKTDRCNNDLRERSLGHGCGQAQRRQKVMALSSPTHSEGDCFKKNGSGGARSETGLQKPGAKALGAWKESLLELSECRPEEVRLDEYYGLVDDLAKIVKSDVKAPEKLREASVAMAEMSSKFRKDSEYGVMLERMLDKVYMVPGGHSGLGALLGGIKIEDEASDAPAYLALDIIRVILRHLYLRGDALRESWSDFLGVCYDAMLRVAVRNKLGNLANIMKDGATSEELCGPNSEICKMAMLRISIYDKRDVPSDEDILKAIRRYPALNSVLDPTSVLESKWRLTDLICHISLDHTISHDGHGQAYEALYESSARIRYWIDMIYRQHGISNNLEYDKLDTVTKKPVLANTNIMVAIKYLVLETWDFWRLYGKNQDMISELKIDDPFGIYRASQEYANAKEMREMRDGFGAHSPCWAFEEAAKHINTMGLDRLVFYARLVVMFQEAAYRAIPSRHQRDHMRDVQRAQIPLTIEPVTILEGEAIKKPYGRADVEFRGQKDQNAYVAMRESLLCMVLLSACFNEARENLKKGTLASYLRFSNEVYNIKYMVLELANFIKVHESMKLSMTSNGKALVPSFLKRKELYCRLRDKYAAHAIMDGSDGMQRLIQKNPGLISDALRDVVEADGLVTRLASEFQEYNELPVRQMTHTEIKRTQRRLDRICRDFDEYANNAAGPKQAQAIQSKKREARRVLELE